MGGIGSGGTNRKSQKLKIVEGNRGHGKKQPPEIEARGAPEMPGYFVGDQVELWNEIVASMPKGTFRLADSMLIERLVLASLRLREAERIVADAGLLVAGAQGIVKNPALIVIHGAERQVVALSDRLGLSPAARTRLHVGKDEDEDDMAWLMN